MSGPAVSTSNIPRLFVSHSHKDDVFTQRLVSDLHAAGAEVWVDVAGIRHGNFMQRIDEALQRCDWMVLVLTPSAIASRYVEEEVYTALHRVKQGYMRAVIPMLATSCVPGSIPPQWDVLQRYDATHSYPTALARLLIALGLAQQSDAASAPDQPVSLRPAPAPLSARPISLPRRRFPERLERLDFKAYVVTDPETSKNVRYILPPLCPVPAGSFLMGSDPRQDSQAYDVEKPQITVDLPAYQIAKFPVTVAEYACFVAALHKAPGSWDVQRGRMDHPVVYVSWYEARDYAAWLARLTGQPWALPSEAEWEKAARWDAEGNSGRGVARIYPWGDRFDSARCNTWESGILMTTPVGTYGSEDPSHDGSSPCGAQDMAGNVWEWTRTIWDPRAYEGKERRENNDSDENRVLHGGSWGTDSRNARAACPTHDRPIKTFEIFGFRMVLLAAAGR